jgi:toxin ParE1/3/4
MNVQVDIEAADEFVAAADWYNDEREGLGDSFLDDVKLSIERLPTRLVHRAHPLHADLGVHIARVGGWPYHLIYVVTGDHYRVIAVMHEKREPGYWIRRVR